MNYFLQPQKGADIVSFGIFTGILDKKEKQYTNFSFLKLFKVLGAH